MMLIIEPEMEINLTIKKYDKEHIIFIKDIGTVIKGKDLDEALIQLKAVFETLVKLKENETRNKGGQRQLQGNNNTITS